MTTSIKLVNDVWQFDESRRLGSPGGFGEVFRGKGKGGDVAIKRLKLTASAAAHREMNIGMALAGRSLDHVVPVLDFGQDAETDRYYLVMPICDCSLQDLLNRDGRVKWEQAKAAALDIIAGLREVDNIVHRDLKPGNVLWHEDRWRIADFGIAKFVEDSTSLETLRSALTPAYAAPEQWLGEAPTRATDVYALGCILHAMINGRPPFGGDIDSIRRAHLNDQPSDLENTDPRLNGLVHFMLRKSAPSRPSLERCATVIGTVGEIARRPSSQALAVAGHEIAQELSAMEAKIRAEETARREREALAKEAIREFEATMKRLFDEIEASSEAVKRGARTIALGSAQLTYDEPQSISIAQLYLVNSRDSGWDVAACSKLVLRNSLRNQSYANPGAYTFSATLAFARTKEDPDFRWRELSFFNWASSTQTKPMALHPGEGDFHMALTQVVSGWQLAHGPFEVDAEDEMSFQERWINLFAKAAQGKLQPPLQMPIPQSFFA